MRVVEQQQKGNVKTGESMAVWLDIRLAFEEIYRGGKEIRGRASERMRCQKDAGGGSMWKQSALVQQWQREQRCGAGGLKENPYTHGIQYQQSETQKGYREREESDVSNERQVEPVNLYAQLVRVLNPVSVETPLFGVSCSKTTSTHIQLHIYQE